MSHRHPAHANISYGKADFTSGRSITVGPNVVSIRSIARNRYDGSIEVLQGPGLATSIPHAEVLKKCSKWLDVVQVELEPGPERLGIEEVRVFNHVTRHGFDASRGLGWQVVGPNIIHVYGLGVEVPEQFDLWIRARSYSRDKGAILQPKVGAQADLAGGKISIAEVQEQYAGWSSESGFWKPAPKQFYESAIRLEWNDKWQGDEWLDVNVVTCDGTTRYAVDSFQPGLPWESVFPSRLNVPWQAIDHIEIRPKVRRRAFFFDGLKTLPAQTRKFDNPPSPSRTTDQLMKGVMLDEFAPLRISARIYGGNEVWPEHHSLLNISAAEITDAIGAEDAFTLLVHESGEFYLPIQFRWKDSNNKKLSTNSLTTGRSNLDFSAKGICRSQIYHESVKELDAVEFVSRQP